MKHIDYHGHISHRWHRLQQNIVRTIFTPICYMKCWLYGVEIGKHCKFGGIISIDRHPGSVIKIGDGCIFNSSLLFNVRGSQRCQLSTLNDNAQLLIGNNSGFSGVAVTVEKSIVIGNNVTIGSNTTIGDNDDHPEILGTQAKQIIIEDRVFIGMRCIILKGVRIGECARIGAGSVVTKDVPKGSVAAGVPAKIINRFKLNVCTI